MALESVLRILFDNVRRYGDGLLHLRVQCDYDEFSLTVWDAGRASSDHLVARLNSGKLMSQDRHGLGLGTQICRRVMEDHGGSIRFSLTPAGGLMVTLHLDNLKGRRSACGTP